MSTIDELSARLKAAIDRQRLIETAVRLVEIPSRTGEARGACDRLAEILANEGFAVERPSGGYPASPAVIVRLKSGRPGRTLQFAGHLDTVHLPFAPPNVEDGRITGSGSCDMKGGLAAAVEALRALRDADALPAGSVLLTAYDLHEAPWGDSRQLHQLIAEGYVGDAVLIPEPLNGHLPVRGRGQAMWKVTIRRNGPPIHEVFRPRDEPSVIAAGAELVARLGRLDRELSTQTDPVCGSASVFIGQLHSGEIFNQYPQECWLEGTRRWLPGTDYRAVEREFRALLDTLAHDTRTAITCNIPRVRDAFQLDPNHPAVTAFLEAYQRVGGQVLPTGSKPFVDDGNSFWALAGVPAITHGPRAGGQHTTAEWVAIDDMLRIAHVYALTAATWTSTG
jgi:acetylornithine deacetylase/succinyl-diaminopimelate desuccinylase-like protein